MRKKLTAILIALTLTISLLPIPAAAVTADEETQIKSAVSKVITDYAAKVNQPNAADDAFSVYFNHGFFGNGAHMTLKESDAMVAAIFNACVTQDALVRAITKGIMRMHDLNEQTFYLNGGTGWHNYYYSYRYSGYRGDEPIISNFLGELLSTQDIYGENRYSGPTNKNDEIMELLVGSMDCDIVIRQIESKQSTTVYSLELQISDRFSFDGDYSEIANKGFDTSTDDTLNNLGYLLTFIGLDEFDWSFQTELQAEVPVYCDHSFDDNYHWTLDTAAQTLISDTANGFKDNHASPIAVTNNENGEVTYLFELDETVILSHNKPWVVEYDLQPMKSLSLSALDHSNTCYPYILQHSNTYVWIPYYEALKLSDTETGHRWHYNGVEILKKFPYSSKQVYSFRIENILDETGGNMPWVTIWDEKGTVVFGPEPLNDYWTSSYLDSTRVLTETDTNKLSGTNIIINYIGSKSNRIIHDQMDLRIWENGKNPAPEASGTYVPPTCTTNGGYRQTCSDCGYQYLTDIEPALGHSYTDFTDDGNTTCTADGTKSRACTVCGEIETITVEGSAQGHDFTAFTDDGNSSCTDTGTKTRTCKVCGMTDTAANEGEPTGHDFGLYTFDHNATCTADGTKSAVCKVCGATDTVPAEGSAQGHTYKADITAPTCTEQGFTTYTCDCGDSYTDDYTAPTAHTEVIDPAVLSTCVEQGKTEGKHCAACGEVTVPQVSAPLDSHTWDAGIVVTQPTLTEAGTLMYTCIHCGEKNYMSIEQLPASTFTDVPADAYYAAAVAWAKANGITSGLSDTLFGSDMSCTRAQVVTFLWRAAGSPEPTAADNPFTDVSESDYYYQPVLWAAEQNITGGIGDGLFGPDQTCTRGQIVTFLWRAKNSPTVSGSPDFTDVSEADWFALPVQWAAENKVTGGIGNNQFGPHNTCTRAQVVTFLYKTYQ